MSENIFGISSVIEASKRESKKLGLEQSDERVNELVFKLQEAVVSGDVAKDKIFQELALRLQPLIVKVVKDFWRQYGVVTSRFGHSIEDVYSESNLILYDKVFSFKKTSKIDDESGREKMVGFAGYFIKVLPYALRNNFVRINYSKQNNSGIKPTSLDEIKTGKPGDKGRLWHELVDEENTGKESSDPLAFFLRKEDSHEEDSKIEKFHKNILELFEMADPLYSLVVILYYGQAQNYLGLWKEKYHQYLDNGATAQNSQINRLTQNKIFTNVRKFILEDLPAYQNANRGGQSGVENVVLADILAGKTISCAAIGKILGISREAVNKRVEKSVGFIKNGKVPKHTK